jgi:hypothetical protein
LRLEPLAGHDPETARRELAAVAASAAEEAPAGRYALAWLQARTGQAERAFDGLHRIIVDWPTSVAATRARVELGRHELQVGHFGAAARWLDEALERGLPQPSIATALRELAVRRLLTRPTVAIAPRALPNGLRNVSSIAALPGGGLAFASRREGRVVRLDEAGQIADEWPVAGLEALATDEAGRLFVAAEQAVWRLAAGGDRLRLLTRTDPAPVEALAVDALGGAWLLDRRGQRIGRAEPGAGEVTPFWEDRAFKLVDLAWDGSRLLALDGRSGVVFAFSASVPLALATSDLPHAGVLTVDASGRIALLDPRAGVVTFTGRDGKTLERFDCSAAGVRPAAVLALGTDGALHLVDQEDGRWLVWR